MLVPVDAELRTLVNLVVLGRLSNDGVCESVTKRPEPRGTTVEGVANAAPVAIDSIVRDPLSKLGGTTVVHLSTSLVMDLLVAPFDGAPCS